MEGVISVPRIRVEKEFPEDQAPKDIYEKFKKALQELFPTLNNFRWEAKNAHPRIAAMVISDEVNIEVVYDEEYYRGPGPAVLLKERAIRKTAAAIATAYIIIDDDIAEVDSVNVTMIPANGDGNTTIVFYSVKPHLAGIRE